MALTVFKNQSGYGAAMITNNKVRFSVVCLSDPMRLTGKFAFTLFPFHPNQFRFLGGPPLGGILENSVDISHLLEAGFFKSQFQNNVLCLSDPIQLEFMSSLT